MDFMAEVEISNLMAFPEPDNAKLYNYGTVGRAEMYD